jgi:hypothetical protein
MNELTKKVEGLVGCKISTVSFSFISNELCISYQLDDLIDDCIFNRVLLGYVHNACDKIVTDYTITSYLGVRFADDLKRVNYTSSDKIQVILLLKCMTTNQVGAIEWVVW